MTSVIGNTLTPVNLTTAKVEAPITLSAGAVRVAAGFGALWVTGTGNEVTEVQPSNSAATVKSYPHHVG